MGETCSACQAKNVSIEEIQAIEEDNKPAAPTQKAPSQKPDTSVKEAPPSNKECEESKRGEKRKEVSVLTSKINQTRAYQKMGSFAVKLESMPDYSNEIVRQKK